jgi:peptidoglycan/LPS O-acetylase OafA/YrhL
MEPTSSRIRSIDALRGVAALAVLLFHYTYWFGHTFGGLSWDLFAFGHYGVELFFVLSGFLIFMTLERSATLYDFAASRIARLYPAYIVAVLLTAFVGGLHPLEPFPTVTWRLTTVNLSMLQNFLGSQSLDFSYWTLGYELVFYVVMGLLFRLRWLRFIEHGCLGWLAFALVGEAIQLNLPLPLQLISLQYYGQFFIIGITIYRLNRGKGGALAWVTLAAAIATCFFVCSVRSINPAGWLYVLVAGVCAALLQLALRTRGGLLLSAPLLFLGDISFPLYLVHLRLGFAIMDAAREAQLPEIVSMLTAALVALSLAFVLHKLIEKPGRKALRRLLARRSREAHKRALAAS